MIKQLTIYLLGTLMLIGFTGVIKAHANVPTMLECMPGQGVTYCIDNTVPIITTITFEGPNGSQSFPYETKSLVTCDVERECIQVISNETFGEAPEGFYLVEQGYHLVSSSQGNVVAFRDGYGPHEATQVAKFNAVNGNSHVSPVAREFDVECYEDVCYYNGRTLTTDELMVYIPISIITGETSEVKCDGPLCSIRYTGAVIGLNAEYYSR